jgi:hypothetical protein
MRAGGGGARLRREAVGVLVADDREDLTLAILRAIVEAA